MLTEVCLRDFKNHADTTIQPGRMTCLVGPNGCGKTSLLEAIQLVSVSIHFGAAHFFRSSRRFEDFIRRETESWSINARTEAGNNAKRSLNIALELNAELKKRGISDYRPNLVTLTWKSNCKELDAGASAQGGEAMYFDSSGAEAVFEHGWNLSGLPDECPDLLGLKSFLFLPQIADLRTPSYSPEETPQLCADGSTLPSVIAYLITTEPDLFATLMQRIRDVLPQVERLRTRRAKVELNEPAQVSTRGKEIHYLEPREVIGHELLFDLAGAPGIPARAVSEGTLLVTALLTATVWNQGADLLLIDDLEKGLHPKAQREMVSALKRLQEIDAEPQIIFSTHSPYIVDELTAEQVWILMADDERGVIARRLSDHPRAADALKVLTTGEFLDAEGEDWVHEAPDAA